jgi:hypothetical protein
MKALFNSKTLTPSSQKNKPPKIPKENLDPNSAPSDSSPYRSPGFSKLFSGRCRSPLPPRPPLKRKLSSETLEAASSISTASDSGVQVVLFPFWVKLFFSSEVMSEEFVFPLNCHKLRNVHLKYQLRSVLSLIIVFPCNIS